MTINAVSDAGGASSTGANQAVDANALIAQYTDSHGRVDTQGLAALVHQASTQDPGKASAAYADIENALAARSPTDASHFAQDTRAIFAAAATGTAAGALKAGGVLSESGADAIARGSDMTASAAKTLAENPILSKTWVGFTSAWTRNGGFSGPLKTLLDQQGISYNETPLRAPPGSLNKSSGVPREKANNINGNLARDQVAARQRSVPGAQVDTEVKEPAYNRRVDVRADKAGAAPTNATRDDFEVKSGRTGADVKTRAQALSDGKALKDNAATRGNAEALLKDGEGLTRSGESLAKAGKALEVGGKVLLPVAVAADAAQLYGAFKADGNKIGVHTGRAASEVAGGWTGALAGGEAGAAIGSFAEPVGTVIGGVAGGIIGGLGGAKIGDAVFDAGRSAIDTVRSWF